MSELIKAALAKLDKANDDHWTSNGAPRMDVVQNLAGDATLTRKQVTDADPIFSRDGPDVPDYGKIGDGREPEADAIAMASKPKANPDEAQMQKDDDAFEKDLAASNAAKTELEQRDADERKEDETDPGFIDPDVILKMDLREAFSSKENLIAFQAAATNKVTEWNKEAELLKRRIAAMSTLSARATARLQRMEKASTTGGDPNIGLYLKGQAKAREERALRAKKFLEANVDKNLLMQELSGKSRLDAALNLRKPLPGSTRPGLR